MYKVSFRCVTYVIGKAWQFCQLNLSMASKTTRLPSFLGPGECMVKVVKPFKSIVGWLYVGGV